MGCFNIQNVQGSENSEFEAQGKVLRNFIFLLGAESAPANKIILALHNYFFFGRKSHLSADPGTNKSN